MFASEESKTETMREHHNVHKTMKMTRFRKRLLLGGTNGGGYPLTTMMTLIGLLLLATGLTQFHGVQGGLIVKRQVNEEPPTTTIASSSLEEEEAETTLVPPTAPRVVDFRTGTENKPTGRAIEFGYDNEAGASSAEQEATVAELRAVDPTKLTLQESEAESTTDPPADLQNPITILPPSAVTQPEAPTTVISPTKDTRPSSSSRRKTTKETITEPETKAKLVATTSSSVTAAAPTARVNSRRPEDDPQDHLHESDEEEESRAVNPTAELLAAVTTTDNPEESVEERTEARASRTGNILALDPVEAEAGPVAANDGAGSGEAESVVDDERNDAEIVPTVESKTERKVPHLFDLERYTSPSNYSEDGFSLEQARADRERFFAEQSAQLTTEQPEEDAWETTTTIRGLIADEDRNEGELGELRDFTTVAPTLSNEVISSGAGQRNRTVESQKTIRLNKTEVESKDYEVVSNEVRNQTGKGKKGKFLDQFGATDDNNINGAAWALAGMRVVERSSGKVGHAEGESVEIVRDEDDNVVSNNTLKQLMDWAAIMQEADFANSSFIRPTSGEVELINDMKDKKMFDREEVTAALSEENRITVPITDSEAEASGEISTIVPRINVAPEVAVTTTTEGDDLEEFKFEDRTVLTTKRTPEITNFIQDTTTQPPSVRGTTTQRPTRSYEVSEFVDESEGFQVPGRLTTSKYEINTNFEDVPVTTYAPSLSVLRKSDVSTDASIPTTFETTRRSRRPTTTTVPVTTSPVDVTTIQTTTTTTSTAAPVTTTENPSVNELSQKIDEQEVSSSEVESNAINQTNSEVVLTTTSTAVPTTLVLDPIVAQQSTIVPAIATSRPAQGTTDKVDFVSQSNGSSEEPSNPEQPVLIDDKNVYDTVADTTRNPSSSPVPRTPEPTAEPTVTTTRRSVVRQMTTTTELSEEESITEEDYVEVNGSAVNGSSSSSRSPLDQQPTESTVTTQAEADGSEEDGGSGVVVAVVASLVSAIVVLLLVAAFFYYPQLQLVVRKRQAQVSYGQRCRPVGLDAYSLDNVSVYNSVRRKGNTMRMSKRSYGNSAFEDPGLKTNPLTVAELANIIQNKTAIYDEFKEIPNITARADEVPEGCEEKNRYANVVPLPETRVHLKRINDDEKTEYINANFVKGPKDSSNYYIACQAPMENTINDFWRMIWEQNSKVIIMATDLSENGVEKCAEYLPPSVVLDNNRTFGDFQLTLKNRENKEKYTISTVHLRNTQTNTWREIMHFWYQWPDTGVPIDESSIIAMLLEARSYSRLAPAEMAEASVNVMVGNGGITSIAEESLEAESEKSMTNNATQESTGNNVDSSNNNNNTNKASGESSPPSSVVANGGSIDKHKSLQRTQGPITVHCSPGTGRTGTIVACDVAMRAIEIPPRNVDIPHTVYYVRRGRASAVRTREQYELIYRVANVYATKLTGPTIET
ncbi:titin homolog isoform X1 [Uranotaenia lowii]|uniref:titin homolog isoform X1 n=1 Tax=Uranotaenia lowii TaxID=190385 RepID=UPI002479A4DF|nr:titin homolog isoform X1 [Uranotaenia lowii]